ncbi:hypothetical protein [Nocardiopsis synnemataformans]|uniref:hypothetical protein n=1 Tax=Nocardiopsis synnemataformans TaxID=61305 RepID=UPI003EBA0E1A
MPTVPRPERPAQPTEADTLRALLDAVANLLDVPVISVISGASIADRHRAVNDRAIIAKVAIRATFTYMDPAVAVEWMREELARLEGGAL